MKVIKFKHVTESISFVENTLTNISLTRSSTQVTSAVIQSLLTPYHRIPLLVPHPEKFGNRTQHS